MTVPGNREQARLNFAPYLKETVCEQLGSKFPKKPLFLELGNLGIFNLSSKGSQDMLSTPSPDRERPAECGRQVMCLIY
jgi:hypothetical protein